MKRFAWLFAIALMLGACTQPAPTLEATSAQAPVISRFGASPTSGTAPLAVRFFWSISDANRDLMSCELDVAYDGNTFTPDYSVGLPRTRTSNCTSSSRINHTFAVGTHTVALRVCDGVNCTIRTQVITANPNPNNRPPILSNLVANPNPAGAGLPTTFSWTTSDPENNPITCTFDPDSSTSGNETTVPCNQTHNHTYTSAGTFTAQLSVSDGANPSVSSSVEVEVVTAFTQISTGNDHTCALTPTGQAYCWGYNPHGQLGNGNTGTNANTPQAVAMPSGITFSQISSGGSHTCALTPTGQAYCWGYNVYGQLGNGNTGTNANTPQAVTMPSSTTFSQIRSGRNHTCALTSAGQAYCWGYNFDGQLGNGNTGTNANTPQAVAMPSGITFSQISAGGSHTCALTSAGVAYCWGWNVFGQRGTGTTNSANTPQLVLGGNTFSQISAGNDHTCALSSAGVAYCWGRNDFGQLGNNNNANANITQLVSGSLTFSQISAGIFHTCAVTSSQAYCWGWNSNGQLGNGNNTDANTPQLVSGSQTFSQISSGGFHSCALTSTNQAYCWGWNGNGQLGTGNNTDANTPQAVVMP